MAKVIIEYFSPSKKLKKREEIATTTDEAYVFEDIGAHMHKGGVEFSSVPKGTRKIVITIPCEM